jgi:hypothetical protein
MTTPVLRARSVGEILDMAFQIYRSRWAAMATATAVLVFPVLALQAVMPLTGALILNVLLGLFYMAASGAVVVIASEAYLGREVAPLAAVGMVLRRFFSVWGAAFLQSLIIGFGFLLLIIPGIIFAAWAFGMQQAVMIEGADASESFERSKDLAEDYVLHILLTSVLTFVIGYLAVTGLSIALQQVTDDVRMLLLGTNLARIAINPLAAVVGTVLYYDLRIRKEAFDVAVATERLADSAPAQPVPAM